MVVFSGNMEYHPNLTAVRFFRREIWPHLRARWPSLIWRLVGKNPHAVRAFTVQAPQMSMPELAARQIELAYQVSMTQMQFNAGVYVAQSSKSGLQTLMKNQ